MMFLIEIKRSFGKRSFKIVMFIGIIFVILQTVKFSTYCTIYNYLNQYTNAYITTPFDNFILFNLSPTSNIYLLIFPLLSALSYSDSYLEDENTGFIKYIYTRKKKINYLVSKFFANFIASGIAIIIPLMLNIIVLLLCEPNIQPHPILGKTVIMTGGLFPTLYYNSPFLYLIIWFVIYFLYAGVFASMGMAFSIFIKNKFAILIIPFIIYITTQLFTELINKQIYSPENFLYLSTAQSFPIICYEFIVIFTISIIVFCIGGNKNETY